MTQRFKNMLRNFHRLFGLLTVAGLAQAASAFTVWGPLEPWQSADLDYGTATTARFFYGGFENGGTKILGAGSRVGVPVITYGFDYTFTEFFGAEGIKSVDAAMAVLNGLPTASGATPNLVEFLTDGNQQINYTAQALSLLDVKSVTLQIMLEHLGLLGETHVFDLNARVAIPNTTCQYYYYVVTRNYDPITYNPSTFVNGVQYGYNIVDFCPTPSIADAIEYPKDTARPPNSFSAVATLEGLQPGGFYLNLTRDDFGGLRWLYRKNHLVNQSIDPNSFATAAGSSPWNPVGTVGTNVLTSTLVGGVERVRFVKVAYDSLAGSTFRPVTYSYTLPTVINGRTTSTRFTRVITQPDIIFTTADLVGRGASPAADTLYARSTTFLPPPAASPGGGPLPNVILPTQLIVYNNANPIYFNTSPAFLSDVGLTQYPIFTWGSFGSASTAPVVYPNGSSIIELENQILAGAAGPASVPTTYNPAGLVTAGVTFLGNY